MQRPFMAKNRSLDTLSESTEKPNNDAHAHTMGGIYGDSCVHL